MRDHPDDPAHVAACGDCQARASMDGLDVDLERVWLGVAAAVWTRRPGPVERVAARLLGSPGLARALVTTPSLLLSWLLASAVILAVGVLVTRGTGMPWIPLLAPALAGAGIAYAYGPGIDPAFELSQTMAVSDRMVLLARALAVFGANAALGIVASFASAGAAGLTLGWLVPMTTVAALGLAAATVARSANVGVVAALAGWSIVVLGSAALTNTRDLAAVAVAPGLLTPAYLMCTLACVAVALYATSGQRGERAGWLWL
jgi:hypothetical protein